MRVIQELQLLPPSENFGCLAVKILKKDWQDKQATSIFIGGQQWHTIFLSEQLPIRGVLTKLQIPLSFSF